MVLVDADIIAYRCTASCKDGDGLEVCLERIDRLMDQIFHACESREYKSYLSGLRNWRKDYYPLYKANRKQAPPAFLQQAKEYLVEHWNSTVSDGLEADDEIAICKTEFPEACIASIDKDFKQLSGPIYNFVNDTHETISPIDATRYLYKQFLLGDLSDNVPGFDGKPRAKPTNLIKQWWNWIDNTDLEEEMYDLVVECFKDGSGDFELTTQLLYLWRKNPDAWTPGFRL